MRLSAPLTLVALAIVAAHAHAAPPQVLPVDKPPSKLTSVSGYLGGRSLLSSEGAARSQWPGFYARLNFDGKAVFFRIGPSHEILHFVLDGHPLPPLERPAPGLYAVDHLPSGPHTFTLLTATESQSAPNTFGGFFLAGGRALPTPGVRRQIEFIGDSHTVGYGNTSPTTQCSDDEVWARTDNASAFGPLLAAHYNAEYQVNAISGRGVVRNYNGFASPTLPEAYPFVLLDGKEPYADPAWQPQVFVVALGTNDFSTTLHPGERWASRSELHADYEQTYARFLRTVRAAHPHALIVVWATDRADGEIEDEAGKVVEQLRTSGDKGIHFLPVDHLAFSACNGHPSLADDRAIEQKLITLIDSQPDPWAQR